MYPDNSSSTVTCYMIALTTMTICEVMTDDWSTIKLDELILKGEKIISN